MNAEPQCQPGHEKHQDIKEKDDHPEQKETRTCTFFTNDEHHISEDKKNDPQVKRWGKKDQLGHKEG